MHYRSDSNNMYTIWLKVIRVLYCICMLAYMQWKIRVFLVWRQMGAGPGHRQGMDRTWIGCLQTIDPKGLNEKY